MGWSLGWDNHWQRDVGYGVPAVCDHPKCNVSIDRGLSFVCGGDIYGGDYGCGLFFCYKHLAYRKPHGADREMPFCPRCNSYKSAYKPKPDVKEWVDFKMTDPSWAEWRKFNSNET